MLNLESLHLRVQLGPVRLDELLLRVPLALVWGAAQHESEMTRRGMSTDADP